MTVFCDGEKVKLCIQCSHKSNITSICNKEPNVSIFEARKLCKGDLWELHPYWNSHKKTNDPIPYEGIPILKKDDIK